MSEMFDDLKELKAMLENGEITPSEYDRLKADLLAENDAPPDEPVDLVSEKPADWYSDPSAKASTQARPRPTPPAGAEQKSSMKSSTVFWVVVGIVLAAILLTQIGDVLGGSTSGGNTSGGSQSPSVTTGTPRVTTAAQGYQSEYGGETSVYNRILGMTDCNALQTQFDIAGDNNDLADPGTPAFERTLGYMVAADDTMEKRGCYG